MPKEANLTAQRGLYYGGAMLRAGDTFEARAEDVEALTTGRAPLASAGTTRKAARRFDAESATRDELEAEAERRGVTVKGTGKDGNILVGDLRKALTD